MADAPALDFSGLNPDCFGKAAYVTRADAERQRQRYLRRGVKGDARGIRAYKCAACGAWHVAGTGRMR